MPNVERWYDANHDLWATNLPGVRASQADPAVILSTHSASFEKRKGCQHMSTIDKINIDQSNSIPPVNDNALGDLECKIVQVPAGLNGSSMWTCIDSKKQGHCPTQQSPQNESISIDSGTSWVTSKTTWLWHADSHAISQQPLACNSPSRAA